MHRTRTHTAALRRMTPHRQVTCLLLLWSFLTAISASICCVGCFLPFWLTGQVSLPSSDPQSGSRPSHLGLFRRCGYPVYNRFDVIDWTSGCGYYPSLGAIPHWSWRVAVVLLGLASCLLVFQACYVLCVGVLACLLTEKPWVCRACSVVYLTAG